MDGTLGCTRPGTSAAVRPTAPRACVRPLVAACPAEIATHTVHHVANPNASEIVGAREWLNETAGIPKEKVVGFRAPYLIFNLEQRAILQKNGECGRAARLSPPTAVEVSCPGCQHLHDWAWHGANMLDVTHRRYLQASSLTPPSASSSPPTPPPLPPSCCGPIPWTTACPRTAPSGGDKNGLKFSLEAGTTELNTAS